MLIFADLAKLVSDTLDPTGVKDLMSTFNVLPRTKNTSTNNSIKNKAKDLVLQYPVLVSDSISGDTSLLLARALEHEYINLISILINSEPIRVINNTENKRGTLPTSSEYLKKFHQNINRSFMDSANITEEIRKSNLSLSEDFNSRLNYDVLNETTIPKYLLSEADGDTSEKPREDDKSKDKFKNSIKRGKEERTTSKAIINKYDVKKINDITPTTINAEIQWLIGDSKQPVTQTLTFGIKSIVHQVSSEDVIFYLTNKAKDSSLLFKLIRWTTGEVSLFKDIILAIDVNKKSAIQNYNRNSYWWRKLSSMSKESKIRGYLGSKLPVANGPIPTASLCISKQDVDTIKNIHGIDLLEDLKTARGIIKSFFLLSFVIVDESTKTVYIYNENTEDYNYFSFSSLDNFAKDTDVDIKKSRSLFK